jgi:hypothetical protein
MPDLREELGRLADFVGEPVSIGELEVARRRRERRRRTEALTMSLVVLAAAALFLATTFRDRPETTPGLHTAPSPPPSGATVPSGVPGTASSIAAACDSRLGQPLTVVEQPGEPWGLRLKGCPFWPDGRSFTLSFETVPPHAAGLALYPRSACTPGPCTGDAVWTGPVGPVRTYRSYRVPPLDPGRYVLLDPVHHTRMAIVVGNWALPPTCNPYHPQVIGTASQLVGCTGWASGYQVTLSFQIDAPGTVMGLALYPARGCDDQGCDRAPIWRAKPFSGPGTRTYRLPKLRFGRYVLLDPLHPASARLLIGTE